MDDALLLLGAGGVVGGGGAGFPTWKKLAAPARTLIVNGAECEPLLKSDQYLMLHSAEALLEGADLLRRIIGAEQAILALKAHYAPQVAVLEDTLSRRNFPVSLCLLPTVYPVGDEQAIVHACTGSVVPPQSLPGSVGCTVLSVSTVLNAYAALHGVPVTRRLVTVAGEVAQPGLYDVPVGAMLSDVLVGAGGPLCSDHRILLGGPMMGALVEDESSVSITKACGGVLVLPSEHLLVRRAALSLRHMRNRAKAACIQCRFCTDLCPRYLLGHALYPHRVMRGFAVNKEDPSSLLCMECGICELYACPMGLSPRRVQAALKDNLRKNGATPDTQLYPRQGTMRGGRQVPSDRLAAQIGVAAYDIPVPEEAIPVVARRVSLPLKQHIGAAAEPIVSRGDRVSTGQTIGRMVAGALGADVHASIDGIVTGVGDSICIEAEVRP